MAEAGKDTTRSVKPRNAWRSQCNGPALESILDYYAYLTRKITAEIDIDRPDSMLLEISRDEDVVEVL